MNRLANEPSPYLRQHADNPVEWYTWSNVAFDAARETDKPVLLSVGYSACHWCHVMAHESFEDEATAKLMNEWFINIKVDREERPDVDALYMEAVQAITGQGGWPMTVFMTPEGKPFFAGTYFPKEPFGGHRSFTDVLTAVEDVWRTRRQDIEAQASQVTQALTNRVGLQPQTESTSSDPYTNGKWWIDNFVSQLHASHDPEWGGFGAAPKFPPSMAIEVLLNTNEDLDREVVVTTLDAMASGGMYDHLGGGFHRYSVDAFWMVPHFEKMLYDQAAIALAYLHAYQATGTKQYRQIAEETIAYVQHDLAATNGGWFSAEDADSEGEEGRFYVWRPDDIDAALDDVALSEATKQWYGVTPSGNFEGSNILHRPIRGDVTRPDNIEHARQLLLSARSKRTRPGLDDKVLTEWNAMFISTLTQAGTALQNNEYIRDAERAATFLLSELRDEDGRWLRAWHSSSRAKHLAYCNDYAWLIDAFTRLSEATGKAHWRAEARKTADEMIRLFWDVENYCFFTTGHDAEQLVVRTKDIYDGATASANSTAAVALIRLSALFGQDSYREMAEQVVRTLANGLTAHPTAFTNLFLAIDLLTNGTSETVVVGDNPELVSWVQQQRLHRNVLLWGEIDDSRLWQGKTDGAYVCLNQVCGLKTTSIEELKQQLAQ